MQSHQPDPVAAFLEDRLSSGASVHELADAVGSAFRGIDRELRPIIGHRGVAALYTRAVHLASEAHPWLPAPQEGGRAAIDAVALRTGLTQQSAADVAAAGAKLLETFLGLLSRLIGASLTERLLRQVWANFLSGPSDKVSTR